MMMIDVQMLSSCSSLRYLLPKLVHAYLLVNVSTAQRGINTCALISPLSPSLFFTHDPQIHAPHLTVSSPSLIKRLVLEQLFLSFCLALVVNCVYLSQPPRVTLVRYSYSKRNIRRRERIRDSVKSSLAELNDPRIYITWIRHALREYSIVYVDKNGIAY